MKLLGLVWFEIKVGAMVPLAPRWLRPCSCTSHIIKLSKLQKYVFHHHKAWEEASFRMFFEKVKASNRKLEIDDPELPKKKKVLSHYEE